jgi:hypothetical protein
MTAISGLNEVQSDTQGRMGAGEVGADLRPQLRPSVISRAEKHEDIRLHVRVLHTQVLLVNASALRQPSLELPSGFDYVHAGNNSGGEKGSQMAIGITWRRYF